MSVTSSGRSSMSSTMRVTSLWFRSMAWAKSLRSMVLPVRGAATMSVRWPLPWGVSTSMTRVEKLCASCSRQNLSSGYSGVSSSNRMRRLAASGASKLIDSILSRAE